MEAFFCQRAGAAINSVSVEGADQVVIVYRGGALRRLKSGNPEVKVLTYCEINNGIEDNLDMLTIFAFCVVFAFRVLC